jgi:hypothetical protein
MAKAAHPAAAADRTCQAGSPPGPHAEKTDDGEKLDLLVDSILLVPPLTDWSLDSRKAMSDLPIHKDLAEDLR